MLRNIWVESTMFAPADDVTETRKDLCWWLEALTQRNQDYLKQRPNTPRLYKSGVKYEAPKQFDSECEEVATLRKALGTAARRSDVARVLDKVQGVLGGEHFCDIGVILELGGIDCDGLACWRAAELRQAGIQAQPYLTHRTRLDGGTTYHALVLWPPFGRNPYPTSEDSSLILGMSQPARAADREEELRKNRERCEDIRALGGDVRRPAEEELAEILGVRRAPQKLNRPAMALEHLLRRAR
jgi:hypothetical protein